MQITALPTTIVRGWQRGGPDAHGHAPEPAISNGQGNPCRHCLKNIPEGTTYLIVAHRPFDRLQPYAECGPLFVCAAQCSRFEDDGRGLPEALTASADYLIKGYSAEERIIYGTGVITAPEDMGQRVADIFADPKVAFVHVRSSRNNCYQARIDRD